MKKSFTLAIAALMAASSVAQASTFNAKALNSKSEKVAFATKLANIHQATTAKLGATRAAEDEYEEMVATSYSAEYYADDQDWFCVLNCSGFPFRFDILSPDPTPLNGTYTLDQMDPSYSWAGTQSYGFDYLDATFTVNADASFAEAYVTLDSGEMIHVTYTKPEAPEITAYVTYEFSANETAIVDGTAEQGLFQIVGDNSEQYASVCFISDQIPGTYTIDDVYMTYTNLYLTADDFTGVEPFAIDATVTREKATVIYDAYDGVEYTLIFNFAASSDDPEDEYIEMEATSYLAEYYADTQDWFCVLDCDGLGFRFDIFSDPTPLNGTYTYDQMDPSYSWAGTSAYSAISYVDATFTVNADASFAEAYVTLTSGEKVHVTYIKPEDPEITAYETVEFPVAQVSVADYTAEQGLFQIVGDNGEQYISVCFVSDQMVGTYTIDDAYMPYTNLYLTADDYTGVRPFAINATITEEKATIIYDAYNGVEYTMILNFTEEQDDPVAIKNITAKTAAKAYSLEGLRVNAKNLKSGVYVVDGQKQIVK